MLKHFFIVILFFLIVVRSNGQWFQVPNLTTFDDRTIHFGFTLGLNTLDFGFKHYNTVYDNPAYDSSLDGPIRGVIDSLGGVVRADIASLTPGFTVGIVSNLRLTENLDLRFIPGLSFGNRKVLYNIPVFDINRPGQQQEYMARATFLDFPLMIKYKSKRIVNHRPYMLAGVAYRFDITKSANENLLLLRKHLFSVEAGMGWDLYLQFFRLSTELKYSFGIGNNLSPNTPKFPQYQAYHMSLMQMTSNVITLSFHFE
jgi:hypothetical protein